MESVNYDQLWNGGFPRVPGKNLVADPTFAQGAAYWTVSESPPTSVVTFGSPGVTLDANGAFCQVHRSGDVVPGELYEVEIWVTDIDGSLAFFRNDASIYVSTAGQHTVVAVADIGAMLVKVLGGTGLATIAYYSIRKVESSMGDLIFKFRDYDGDKPQFSIPIGNAVDGAAYTTMLAQRAAVVAALGDVILGNFALNAVVAEALSTADVNHANPASQAHLRWVIPYYDAATGAGPYHLKVTCADITNADLRLVNSDQADMTAAEWVALVAALENIMLSPAGNGINVAPIYLEE